MKKFLKVFIIVLLVIGVVVVTTYFFFRRIKEKDNTTTSIVALLNSSEKLKFNSNLNDVYVLMKSSDDSDQRMDLIIQTNNKLDEIVYTLSTYFIQSNTKINDEAIAKKLNQVEQNRKILNSMITEYNIKKDSTLFDKNLGANDLYVQVCSYLIDYAEFANLLNQEINVNKTSDLKFSMFEIYCNVVVNTFSKTNANEIDTNKVTIENSENIDIMNSVLKIRSSYVVKIENENTASEKIELLFTQQTNLFIENYNKCNKKSFANNLSENLDLATEIDQTNNEITASYYFNLIYGI